ncbi:hypothetical protein SAMD00019534_072570 [Acytostelium subglobosum LB1]|uniref:hypothetical protein n=1 Tax=Acytostelium subglobosum LB1 TaxID=1410327 RepID=UPI000644A2EE|nr:hypothetical protein SAMD00019534_072570 [Acytostelium subglobosum LB1]GAM24082.1 hypothetical protein SAMD00019534_072570 [Acytostelium subglobosum LB1]|eukprot:XP_012753118.1 hypothetical protein SAMD00019534_072570 [Acytostelium subglobosum LB1]
MEIKLHVEIISQILKEAWNHSTAAHRSTSLVGWPDFRWALSLGINKRAFNQVRCMNTGLVLRGNDGLQSLINYLLDDRHLSPFSLLPTSLTHLKIIGLDWRNSATDANQILRSDDPVGYVLLHERFQMMVKDAGSLVACRLCHPMLAVLLTRLAVIHLTSLRYAWATTFKKMSWTGSPRKSLGRCSLCIA